MAQAGNGHHRQERVLRQREEASMDQDDFFDLQVLFHKEREIRVVKPRLDPIEAMSDAEFKRTFRFR